MVVGTAIPTAPHRRPFSQTEMTSHFYQMEIGAAKQHEVDNLTTKSLLWDASMGNHMNSALLRRKVHIFALVGFWRL
ncbi:hypothetical protein NL64_27100 [Pseudomonas fluorescens]|nr:hypothetical protein NL64_27100 [Pseudomonas fluorescens]